MSRTSIIAFSLMILFSLTITAGAADYVDPTTGMEFALIKGGTFQMGDLSGQDKYALPVHEVTIKSFYMGKYEVTFEQYDNFCDATGRVKPNDEGWGRGSRPVINVSWYDAEAFTKWLSEESGRSFRLPSEAEWEYAARGGRSTIYPWGDAIGRNKASCDGCGSQWDKKTTAPVGSFEPNGYGLYDIVGNVYEWNLDTNHNSYEGAPTDGSAWVTPTGRNLSIYRSASWRQTIDELEITQRCTSPSQSRDNQTGFRVGLYD